MPNQLSFDFPNLKNTNRPTKNESNKKSRKKRSDAGTVTCIWCGKKVHEYLEIHLFQRKDNNNKFHHIGYTFSKEDMKNDPLFDSYVKKTQICEDCHESIN